MKKQWIVLDYSPEKYCNLKIDVIGYDKSKRLPIYFCHEENG